MHTKKDNIEQPASCFNKAALDEPIFVLRAKDPLAASAVEYWAKQAESSGLHAPAKANDARHVASLMRNWRDDHVGTSVPTAQAKAANKFEG